MIFERISSWVLMLIVTGIIVLLIEKTLAFFRPRKRVKIRKILRGVLTAMLIPSSIASAAVAVLAEGRLIPLSIWTFLFGNEFVCYALTSAAYLRVFALITKKSSVKTRWILACIASLLFTAEVFLINNLLHMMSFWGMFGFEGFSFREDLLHFLNADFHYTLGFGLFRYGFVFILQMLVFGIQIVVQSEKARLQIQYRFFRLTNATFAFLRRVFHRNDLARLTRLWRDEKLPLTAIAEYIDRAENDACLMYDLARCAEKYEAPFYLDLLFYLYGKELSKRQYLHYRTIFLDCFDIPLCDACEKLDQKYAVAYSGPYRNSSKVDPEED